MRRDGAPPALAALLALLALPVAGLASGFLLPTTPGSYYPVALGLCLVFLVGIAPAAGRTPLRPLTLALAAAPFFVFAAAEGGGGAGSGWPSASWLVVLGLSVAVAALPRRRFLLGALLVVLLGGGAVLVSADLDVLPDGWNPVSRPLAAAPGDVESDAGPARTGVRVGAPVRVEPGRATPLAGGAGPWWERAARARHPGPRPVVLLLDRGAGAPPPAKADGEATLVRVEDAAFTHGLDLAGYDVVMLRSAAWTEDDPAARARARAVADFVRGGGLLVGPAPDAPWPPHLGRALRAAARTDRAGPAGVRPLGNGRVVRAGTTADAAAALAARLWVPAVDTAFGRFARVPAAPPGIARWHDDPSGRLLQGVLLLLYAAALGAFAWLVRAPRRHLLVVLAAAGAASAGIVWLSPGDPGFSLQGLVVEVGGAGGRRLEALVVSAGPRGFEREVRWTGGGVVSLHGAALTPSGAVRVGPGRRAWILRERLGTGPAAEDEEDRRSGWLRPLLVGDVQPGRLRFGRLPALPVRVGGVGKIPAATLLYRPETP